jgi:hypothetical protein
MNDVSDVEQPPAEDRLARRREHLMSELIMRREVERAAAGHDHQRSSARPSVFPLISSGRRRLFLTGAVAAATVAISVAWSVVGGPSGQGPAAFAVTPLDSSTLLVKVVDSQVGADAMNDQLHRAGIALTVHTVPASPQLVGRWLEVGADAKVPGALADDIADQALNKATALVVPRSFPGQLTLVVGRSARPGEQLQVQGTPNALAPGGLLACLHLHGSDPATAARALGSAGWKVQWAVGGARTAVAAPKAGQRVVQAYIYDEPRLAPRGFIPEGKAVQVVLASPQDEHYDTLLQTGFSRRAAQIPDGC